MDSQHQLAAIFDELLVRGQIDWLRHGFGKTAAERQALVRLTEAAQKLVDALDLAPALLNGVKRGWNGGLARLNTLEQPAFECPAAGWALVINAAECAVPTRARLEGSRFPAFLLENQAECPELVRVIPRLQFDIAEQNTIAAQTATRAKLSDRGHSLPADPPAA